MKRWIAALLSLTMMFSLAACGSKDSAPAPESTDRIQESVSPPKAPEKTPEKAPENVAGTESALQPIRVMKGGGYVDEWDEEFNQLILATWEEIALIDEYPGLAAALEELNIEQAVGGYSFHQEWLPYAQEQLAMDPEYFGGYTAESAYTVQRADSLVLSIREDFSSYTGGVHGNYGAMGWNFDTATGKRLELADVLTDTECLDEILVEKIRTKYTFAPFDSLDEMLSDYAPENYTWTVGYQGITFYFSPYEIASYAVGLLTATIWFDEMPELFREEYMLVPEEGYAVALPDWHEIEVDMTGGDSARDTVSFWMQPDEYGSQSMVLTINGNEYREEAWKAFSMTAYLVCTKDRTFYLYVNTSGENDYRTMYIYELSGGTPRLMSEYSGAGLLNVWDPEAGTNGINYYVVFNDPREFTMGSKCNLLGTKTAYRNYTVNADGTIRPLSDDFELDQTLEPIVSTVALNVQMLEENREETVPAGTAFVFLRTDNETYVDLMLPDGRACRIVIEEIDWTPCINGVPEWECFENLMYAG